MVKGDRWTAAPDRILKYIYIEDVGELDLCKQASLFFHTIVLQVTTRKN